MNTRQINYNQTTFRVQLRDDVDESVLAEIFKYREYRAGEEIIRAATDPIVDLGAHAGFFTLYCRALNPTVSIFAIEPAPANLKQLHQHLAQNQLSHITIVEAAIGANTETRQLILTPDSHNHYLAPSSKKTSTEPSVMTQTYRWTDFCAHFKLNSISLLKIDIEGGEREIFTALQANDLALVQAIILEYHNTTDQLSKIIETILREHGFSVTHFPSHFDKQFGFLFARNKRCHPERASQRRGISVPTNK